MLACFSPLRLRPLMPTDTAQQTLILQLRTEIDRPYDCAANPSGSPFRKKYEEVAALWDKLRSQVDKSNRGEIADFSMPLAVV